MLSSHNNRIQHIHLTKVEVFLILFLLIFGLPMIVFIPPGAGYDEEDHLVRVWELSAFSFIPGEMSPQELKYPTVFRDFAYRQQGSKGTLDSRFWQRYTWASLSEKGFVRRELNTKSVYSPALLFPQAMTMRILGRSVNLSTLPVFYLSRLANLLSYLVLTWLAVRLMPFGKWILFVLVISPMALFQAATITPDAISNGIGFLFIAGCLRVARDQEIGWRHVGSLVLLVFLLFLAKVNLIVLILLPFLLISPSQFASKKFYFFLLIITLVFFSVEVAGWNLIASRNLTSVFLEEANPQAQLLYILGHPLAFLQTLVKDIVANGPLYLQSWINGYGYYYWTPPFIVAFFYLLSLVVVTFIDSTNAQVGKKDRVVFLLLFVASYLVTIVSLYTSFTPVGSDQIFGVQGRYFIPLALPLVLILSSFSWKRTVILPSKWGPILLATGLSLNLLGLFLSFHVLCGSTFYRVGLCYRPLFRDFPSEVRASQPVSNTISLTQEINVTCNGLAEVRVLLTSPTTIDPGTTRFVVEEISSNQTLLDTSIANDRVHIENWYSLGFKPAWDSAGKQYLLTITGTTNQGPRLLYTPQPEFNLGNSYENSQLLEEDLVLQYGCITGLQKILLTGKP
jgi:uncharacterized membrane protein